MTPADCRRNSSASTRPPGHGQARARVRQSRTRSLHGASPGLRSARSEPQPSRRRGTPAPVAAPQCTQCTLAARPSGWLTRPLPPQAPGTPVERSRTQRAQAATSARKAHHPSCCEQCPAPTQQPATRVLCSAPTHRPRRRHPPQLPRLPSPPARSRPCSRCCRTTARWRAPPSLAPPSVRDCCSPPQPQRSPQCAAAPARGCAWAAWRLARARCRRRAGDPAAPAWPSRLPVESPHLGSGQLQS
mmetsp:Transcript_5466/g.23112  ORF Transcript_5466/g.23112 Transcript_5466/m.23112 type:complete len:245 (-) Transcript_5466:332-1066(-)